MVLLHNWNHDNWQCSSFYGKEIQTKGKIKISYAIISCFGYSHDMWIGSSRYFEQLMHFRLIGWEQTWQYLITARVLPHFLHESIRIKYPSKIDIRILVCSFCTPYVQIFYPVT